MTRRSRGGIGAALLLLAGVGLGGCGSTGLQPGPLQAALNATFTNLYILQQVEMGSPKPSPDLMRTTSGCVKGSAHERQSGAGNDWVCNITYNVPGLGTSVTAMYNVTLKADGCYAAESDGPAAIDTPVGSEEIGVETRTITGPGGRVHPNPIWLIDGCFDIS